MFVHVYQKLIPAELGCKEKLAICNDHRFVFSNVLITEVRVKSKCITKCSYLMKTFSESLSADKRLYLHRLRMCFVVFFVSAQHY